MKIQNKLREILTKDTVLKTFVDKEDKSDALEYIINNYKDDRLSLIYVLLYAAKRSLVSWNDNLSPRLREIFEDLLEFSKIPNSSGPYADGQYKLVMEGVFGPILRDELKKIIDYFNRHFKLNSYDYLANNIPKMKIEFSNSRVANNYGSVSFAEIISDIKGIDSKNNITPNTRGVLGRLRESIREDGVRADLFRRILDEYKEYSDIPKREKKVIDDIISKIRNMKFSRTTLGTFNGHNKVITLYVEAIFDYAVEQQVSFKSAMLETFAHEVFHAAHYCIVKKIGWMKTPEIIKESFAAYFEYLYSNHRNIYVFDLETDWLVYDMHTYPYSGAKYLHPHLCNMVLDYIKISMDSMAALAYSSKIIFANIFQLALCNPDRALDVLEVYYRLDN